MTRYLTRDRGGRRRRRSRWRRCRYFTRIVSSAVLTQQTGTPYDVVEHVRRQLIEVLGLPKPGARPSQRARLVAVALAGLAGHAIGDSSAHAA